jgi:tetratricopeptide (TPR) repeat protein
MMNPTYSVNLPMGVPALAAVPQQNNVAPIPIQKWQRYHELALAARDKGDNATAEAMWLAALEHAEENGVDGASVAVMFDELAGLYYASGEMQMAEIFCRRALYAFSTVYETKHTTIAYCLNNLAGICYGMGRLEDAETLCKAALDMFEQTLGAMHDEVALALHNLAMIYHRQSRFVHAERNYRRALAIRTKTLGYSDSSVKKLIDNYATMLETTDRREEATALRRMISSS